MSFNSQYFRAGTSVTVTLQLEHKVKYPDTEQHYCYTSGPELTVTDVCVDAVEQETAVARRREISRMLDLPPGGS